MEAVDTGQVLNLSGENQGTERNFTPIIALGGLALVMNNLSDIPSDTGLSPVVFGEKVRVIDKVGRISRIVISELPKKDWRDILDAIPEEYLVHVLSIKWRGDVGKDAKAELIVKVRELKEELIPRVGELNAYNEPNGVSIRAGEYLDVKSASFVLESIENIAKAYMSS